MKKIYLFSGAVLFSGFVLAQNKTVGESHAVEMKKMPASGVKTPTDTLWGNLFNWSPPTIYLSQNGGYVAGHNGYGDKQKAQRFLYLPQGSNYKVEGALLWFGGYVYTSGNPNSKVDVRVYNANGSGTASSGPVNNAPGTVLGSVPLLLSSIDTSSSGNNGWVAVTFSSPITVTGDYHIGINLAVTAPGDTLGLVSSNDGGSEFQDFSWEEWSPSGWYTFFESNSGWGLDIDLAIFAIISDPVSSIDEMGYTNGIKFITYPNPVINEMTITYDVQNAGEVKIEIRDITGKIIKTVNEGHKTSGRYTASMDVRDLSAGNYLVSVSSGTHMIAQKITITR